MKSKPAKSKPVVNRIRQLEGLFSSSNDIPKAIKDHAEENGYELRWLNGVKLRKDSGIHPRHWRPLKIDYDKMGLGDMKAIMGESSDGFMYSGDRILGYRSKELCEQHREYNQLRADRQKDAVTGYNLESQKAFRESAREAGMAIREGYDGEDE